MPAENIFCVSKNSNGGSGNRTLIGNSKTIKRKKKIKWEDFVTAYLYRRVPVFSWQSRSICGNTFGLTICDSNTGLRKIVAPSPSWGNRTLLCIHGTSLRSVTVLCATAFPSDYCYGTLIAHIIALILGRSSTLQSCRKSTWAFWDLNPGQTGYEPGALTNWAKSPTFCGGFYTKYGNCICLAPMYVHA